MGKKWKNSPKQPTTQDNTMIESDIYGLRFDKGNVIGHTPVTYKNDKLVVHNKNFVLTERLLQLLLKRVPQHYESEDLVAYKNILELTNAHKKPYKADRPVNSNGSWKYRNIISLLFPPKRRRDVKKANDGKKYSPYYMKKSDTSQLKQRHTESDPYIILPTTVRITIQI
ncbi:hypothetical protein JTB14_004165 [Gonioctena quinquepunctata]|nr:hypothetical protein JTB14_004165 [Gonioctena quinquepunctata]